MPVLSLFSRMSMVPYTGVGCNVHVHVYIYRVRCILYIYLYEIHVHVHDVYTCIPLVVHYVACVAWIGNVQHTMYVYM